MKPRLRCNRSLEEYSYEVRCCTVLAEAGGKIFMLPREDSSSKQIQINFREWISAHSDT